MNIKYTSILDSIKKMKPRDFIYPSVVILFLSIVAIVFFLAVQFISKNINNVFSYDQSGESLALDIVRYTKVAKKLNIVVITSNENITPTEVTAVVEIPKAETATTTVEVTTPTLDKSTFSIMIINSTKKSGLAAELAKVLTDAGFTAPKTGNQKKLYTTTTILVKESKYDYAPLLLESVLQNYPFSIATTTPETDAFDATIIIGTK